MIQVQKTQFGLYRLQVQGVEFLRHPSSYLLDLLPPLGLHLDPGGEVQDLLRLLFPCHVLLL